MINNFVGLCPSVSNQFLLKMQSIKVLNPQPPIKGGTFIGNFWVSLSLDSFLEMLRKNNQRNTAVVYYLSIQGVIKKDNIACPQYFFLCQCIELFSSKHHFTFFWTLFKSSFYLEYMKKVQSQRLDDISTRLSSEIQAKY